MARTQARRWRMRVAAVFAWLGRRGGLLAAALLAMLALPASALGASGWSAPVAIGAGGSASVSCSTPSFCVAVGGTDAVIYRAGAWGPGRTIDRAGLLDSVSCPPAALGRFCAATDAHGNSFFFNGIRWSPAVRTGLRNNSAATGPPIVVSCASTSLCVAATYNGDAVQVGQVSIWRGHSWGPRSTIDNNAGILSVSCPLSSFCVAVDFGGVGGGFGSALFFNGSSWTPPVVADNAGTTNSVSCTSRSFCVAIDNQSFFSSLSDAVVYNGSGWSTPTTIGLNDTATSVSCATSSFCTAVGMNGSAVTFDGGGWSAPVDVNGANPLNSVSCPTRSFCAAVGGGFAATYVHR